MKTDARGFWVPDTFDKKLWRARVILRTISNEHESLTGGFLSPYGARGCRALIDVSKYGEEPRFRVGIITAVHDRGSSSNVDVRWEDDPRGEFSTPYLVQTCHIAGVPEDLEEPANTCADCGTSLQSAAYDVNATRCRACLDRIAYAQPATIAHESAPTSPATEAPNTAKTTRYILDPASHTLTIDSVTEHETYAGGIETLGIVERNTAWLTDRPCADTLAIFAACCISLYVVESLTREEDTVPAPEYVMVYGIDQLTTDVAKRAISANWEALEQSLLPHHRLSAEVTRQCSLGIPIDRAVTEAYEIVLDRMIDFLRESSARFTASGQRIQ